VIVTHAPKAAEWNPYRSSVTVADTDVTLAFFRSAKIGDTHQPYNVAACGRQPNPTDLVSVDP
jgi:hypothetical protein